MSWFWPVGQIRVLRFFVLSRRGFKLGISELLANFSAFIDSKRFDLSNRHVPEVKSQILWHIIKEYIIILKKCCSVFLVDNLLSIVIKSRHQQPETFYNYFELHLVETNEKDKNETTMLFWPKCAYCTSHL